MITTFPRRTPIWWDAFGNDTQSVYVMDFKNRDIPYIRMFKIHDYLAPHNYILHDRTGDDIITIIINN